MLKKILSSVICLISIFSCTAPNNVILTNKQDTYIVDVGKGKLGAKFSAELRFTDGFNTKANLDGNEPKVAGNISKVDAFLIEVTSAPAAGSDPLASVYAVVPNIPKTSSGTFSITFANVPDNEAGKRYYVGIITKDITGKTISKNPSPDWTGDAQNKGLWVTNGGGDVVNPGSIRVTSALNVSSTTALTVSIPVLDVTGATIETNATVTPGNTTLPAIDAIGI
ncbi:MAG: hypothetical protein ACK4IX_13780 [Candidatus Sericytochromatia bacterium]